jgi:hypothetical protein
MLLEVSRTQTQDARPMPIAAQRQYVEQLKPSETPPAISSMS